jgi:hypothetical protein
MSNDGHARVTFEPVAALPSDFERFEIRPDLRSVRFLWDGRTVAFVGVVRLIVLPGMPTHETHYADGAPKNAITLARGVRDDGNVYAERVGSVAPINAYVVKTGFTVAIVQAAALELGDFRER